MENHPETLELVIQGMDCNNCALGIEKQLRKLGVHDVNVDFANSTAHFKLGDAEGLPKIINEIERLGYRILSKEALESQPLFSTVEGKFLFCLIFTVPLFLHMFVSWHWLHNPWVQLALCLPVYILGTLHFGRSGLASLRSRMPNMDVLIFIGINAAFIYSLAGTLLGLGEDYLFYETSATITTIVLFGNLLEKRCVRKTTSAVEELNRIQTVTAKVLRGSGRLETVNEIDASSLHLDDRFLVNAGDRIPADGLIYWGSGTVDESMISGESLPVDRELGEKVICGTTLLSGSIKAKAVAVKDQTVLGNIIKLIRDAQTRRPKIQRIGDTVSGFFIPAVTLFAIATFAVTYFALGVDFQRSLLNSIAVLVVACPCAVGLATPAAVIVGIGRAARRGILVRGGNTLEEFAGIRTIVFDKTGTLTTGNFKIRSLQTYNVTEQEARSLILSLEKHSSHPIARSLVREMPDAQVVDLSDVTELKGLGIRARDSAGNQLQIGSSTMADVTSDGPRHDVYLTKNGEVIATIDIEDEVKADVKTAISELKVLGISTVLLSGDSETKCANLAERVGIQKVFSGCMPEKKLEVIRDLEREGAIAFVGDGINDAPALAKATVGISLSDATQVAIQSAQVVLLNGNIGRLVEAVKIARHTFRVIKQNLFWAFFYNILAIPFAAAGYLNPMLAAFAMGFSDVVVILNSLRLRTTRL